MVIIMIMIIIIIIIIMIIIITLSLYYYNSKPIAEFIYSLVQHVLVVLRLHLN